jgi:ketosteroid isomerase-like protein
MNSNSDDPAAQRTIQIVSSFNDALNAHDVDAMMQLMTEDCVFESTWPAPDGTRYEGQTPVRAFWREFFGASQDQTIEVEEIWAAGNRCVMRWVYRWTEADGEKGHVRGVDIYTVRGGQVASKLSYVKG